MYFTYASLLITPFILVTALAMITFVKLEEKKKGITQKMVEEKEKAQPTAIPPAVSIRDNTNQNYNSYIFGK